MSQTSARIRRIEFENFKALRNYALALTDMNILVGPNNSGKSTIIGALRTLDAALRFARARAPMRLHVGDIAYVAYRIPADSVPISLENVLTDYKGSESRVTFHLTNRNTLTLIFPEDGGCVLLPQVDGGVVTSAAMFKREFPLSIVIVPVLGPVEHQEKLRERPTVIGGLSTHRASRHFRSYWHYAPQGFSAFADLVERTWPDLRIEAPILNPGAELAMFCYEGRTPREIYWVGFGFQVWCQLLTHLSRVTPDALLVVDEPEVYLHPDVQRQMLGIIRDLGAEVLMATHSSEIIAEADPSEIVLIDKRQVTAIRLKNIAGVQRALNAVGSAHNITLTALARSRRVLFVEGLDDFQLIRRFARRMGLQELSSGAGIAALESGGFGSWRKVTILASGIAEALGAPLLIGAVYDRDYYCPEQITEVVGTLSGSLKMAWVLERKEIENYLLVPAALDRAVVRAIADRRERTGGPPPEIVAAAVILEEITQPMRDDIVAQLLARAHDFLLPKGQDRSVLNKAVMVSFAEKWSDLETRMALVPGKEVLREFRQRVQDLCGVTLTDARITEAMSRDEVPADMRQLLAELDVFRVSNVQA
jgi:ABC-type Mn2+/Zn2+ transport system ATPase subunit